MPHVAVIGGGPAGSTLATLLAQRNFDVTLFEAERFPRAHIGESLLPATIETLDLTGAGDLVRQAGFTKKGGATMSWGSSSEPWSWFFSETNQRQPHSYQVNRDEFDQILLNHAKHCGVNVFENTKVKQVLFEGDEVTGIQLDDRVETADFVVDATGQNSLIANQLKSKEWDSSFQNVAIYGYFEGGAHLDAEESGNILIEACEDGWFWKIPLKNNVSSVGLVADSQAWRSVSASQSVKELFNQSLDATQYVKPLLKGATPIGDFKATRDWSYRANSFTGSNYCLIGDAACFIDPLFSTGVHLAIYSAVIASAYIRTWFSDATLGKLAAKQFESSYLNQYSHFRELARLFYGSNRTVNSYFWQAREITGESAYQVREAFIRAVSGQVVHGYERTTLEHGVLPPQFLSAMNQIETERKERQKEWDRFGTTTTPFKLVSEADLVKGVTLGDLIYEESYLIRRPSCEDLPLSDLIGESLLAMKPNTTVQDFLRQAPSNLVGSQKLDKMLLTAWRLLYIDGVIELANY